MHEHPLPPPQHDMPQCSLHRKDAFVQPPVAYTPGCKQPCTTHKFESPGTYMYSGCCCSATASSCNRSVLSSACVAHLSHSPCSDSSTNIPLIPGLVTPTGGLVRFRRLAGQPHGYPPARGKPGAPSPCGGPSVTARCGPPGQPPAHAAHGNFGRTSEMLPTVVGSTTCCTAVALSAPVIT